MCVTILPFTKIFQTGSANKGTCLVIEIYLCAAKGGSSSYIWKLINVMEPELLTWWQRKRKSPKASGSVLYAVSA